MADLLVNQRTNFDCAVAATAMYLGQPYEKTAGLFYDVLGCKEDHGIYASDIVEALGRRGVPAVTAPFYIHGVPGVITGPSLNFPGKMHAMYWTGKHILDPQHGRDKKRWYKMSEHVTAFGCVMDARVEEVAYYQIKRAMEKVYELEEIYGKQSEVINRYKKIAENALDEKFDASIKNNFKVIEHEEAS